MKEVKERGVGGDDTVGGEKEEATHKKKERNMSKWLRWMRWLTIEFPGPWRDTLAALSLDCER